MQDSFTIGPGLFRHREIIAHATGKQVGQKGGLAQIPDNNPYFLAGKLVPEPGPLRERRHGIKRQRIRLHGGVTAEIVVHHGDFVAPLRKMHGAGPPQVAVASKNHYAHDDSSLAGPASFGGMFLAELVFQQIVFG